MRQLLAAVAALTLGSLPSAEEAFKTVMRKDGGGPKKAIEAVIRSENEWKAFVGTVSSESHRILLAKEKFNFETEVVVAVARGGSESVPTTADGVTKVTVDGEKATVEWTVIESDQRESEKSYPFHVIKLPKVKDIKFKKTKKAVGG